MRILLYIILIISVCSTAEAAHRTFGLDINYPGMGVRFFLSNKAALELKGQYLDDIYVAGLRGYYFIRSVKGLNPFLGIEMDYVNYRGDDSEGIGGVAELLAGAEVFITKRLSFQADIGPAFIFLYDDEYEENVDGMEIIMNIGLNWYFGKELKR